MRTNRRDFLKTTAAAGGALAAGVGPLALAGCAVEGDGPAAGSEDGGESRAANPLKILILGGTGFIGPHQVEYALSRGHEVTLFNRGRTNAQLFPEVEKLVGDRESDLTALEGRSWDVVVDNSATNAPHWVEASANLLKDTCERYIFVSTRSVYADTSRIPMTIDAPVWTHELAGVEPGAERLPYGLGKAVSEQIVRDVFGEDRTIVMRPGLIIGPGDPTDRFTYWPVRIHRGGEVLAPGDGTDPVQIIDVRDFGDWLVRMAEAGESGTYNVVGPRTPRPMAELLYGIRAVTTAETTFTWVDTDFVIDAGLRPYGEMPVWRPARDGAEGFARFDLTPEVEKGLTFRSLADTTAATLEFHFSRPAERQAEVFNRLSPEQEAEVLADWHASQRG
ncbi:MAG: NAD-dependent epimerase/dehydratase family protein [Gemmatimonadetes bacterium]|nr:NAD-dependent epimerase/dehydratase family protein [Gemmatimonadota bacterium]MYG22909.1 NAD-dependent epimerase/dehydratase family protein [Gemmatimonadota bacterium]MYJ38383.1 NAD-dependent epimerase/dehydratase family protein [Gemmatimonadota bacterium]